MEMYRIICFSKDKKDCFAEKVCAPLRVINNDIYYTDFRGRSWCCTFDWLTGRIVTDPEILVDVFSDGRLVKLRGGTGRPARLSFDCIESLRKYKPATAEKYLTLIENAIRKNHPAWN